MFRTVDLPGVAVLVPGGNLDYRLRNHTQDYRGLLPTNLGQVVADLTAQHDGVPVTIEKPRRPQHDRTLLLHTDRYVMRLFPSLHRDAYTIAMIHPIQLRDYRLLTEACLLVRTTWQWTPHVRDIPGGTETHWTKLTAEWDKLTAGGGDEGDVPGLNTEYARLLDAYKSLSENGKRLLRRASLLNPRERLDSELAALLLDLDVETADKALTGLGSLGPDILADDTVREFGAALLLAETAQELDDVRDRLRRWRGVPPKTAIARDFWTTNDLLDYRPYADAIANFLRHRDTRPPLTIGIKGPWGAGKTSLMRMVQEQLDPLDGNGNRRQIRLAGETAKRARRSSRAISTAEVVHQATQKESAPQLHSIPVADQPQPEREWRPTVWFNPWMYQSGEQIWAGLAHEIIEQVTGRLPLGDRERFWLRLNLARLDRQAVRRRAYRLLAERLLPLLMMFGGLLLLVAGAWVVSSLVGVWVGTVRQIAAGAFSFGSSAVLVAGVVRTIGFWRESAHSVFGPLVSGSTVVHSQLNNSLKGLYEETVPDPNYHARTGFLHLVQLDMKRVLDLVATSDQPLVVFVDDLDRCTPGPISQVIEAINLFLAGEFPNCMFVLAMEPQVIAASIEVAYKDLTTQLNQQPRSYIRNAIGWRFLEKIVQLPISLPTMDQRGHVTEYVRKLLGVPDRASSPETGFSPTTNPPADVPIEAPLPQPLNRPQEDPRVVSRLESEIRASSPTLENLAETARAVQTRWLNDLDQDMDVNTIAAVDRVFADLYSDADAHEAIAAGISLLGPVNPREVKRFINLFRFYTFIAYRQRLNGGESVTSRHVTKLAALAIRWPSLLGLFAHRFDSKQTGLEVLQKAAQDESEWISATEALGIESEPQLRTFLAAQPNIASLAARLL